MIKITYEELKYINKPILLLACSDHSERLRILYPSGLCEYLVYKSDLDYLLEDRFHVSCFVETCSPTLLGTIEMMEYFDKNICAKLFILEQL